ncbi:MAG TPA: DUF1573 domain-containing protein [Phycisphaerales bacterium]|nr:DUF1573 domain-containing protein [Phycisphaerales bacterium]HMP35853.1 DUF1573 domain-containing protein [Phycisphaerales bacterium]
MGSNDRRAERFVGAILLALGLAICGTVLGRHLPDAPPGRSDGPSESDWDPAEKVVDLGVIELTPADGEGIAPRGALVRSHRLSVRNRADHPRRIEEVRTSCGCVVAQHPTGAIPPRGTFELDLSLTLGAAGRFAATLWIRWDDGEIEARRLRAVVVRPSATVFLGDSIVGDRYHSSSASHHPPHHAKLR